jgi:LCP family protein required for cell wall assembly
MLIVFGSLLMVASGGAIVGINVLLAQATKSVTQTNLLGDSGNAHHVDINGPVNLLLVGIDTRPGQNAADPSRSDSIIVVHIPAAHDRAYLVSIPRDTLVQIPADPQTGFAGGEDKINAAFAFGSQNGGGIPGGTALLAKTIKTLYGIGFDAAAVVDFAGFRQVVDVLGGVDLCVDEKVTSIHIGFTRDGVMAPRAPFHQDASGHLDPVPGVTPQVYNPGCQHLNAWQALDYARQRDLLTNGDGDYGRQRHQQQFIKAIVNGILSKGVLTDPPKLAGVLGTVGKAMTVDTRGIPIQDWIFAMRGINTDALTTIKTNNGQYNSSAVPGIGDCETLTDTSLQLLRDVSADNVAGFVTQHPDWVNQS